MLTFLLDEHNPDETAAFAKEVEASGMADLLELNVSCPMPADTVGMHIGKSAALTAAQVRAVRDAVKLPVTVKLTPNVTDIVSIASAAKQAGADGVTIGNSLRCFAGVNIETGRPYLRAYGGYGGPAIKPVIMQMVTEVAKRVGIPISAAGGVMSWQDAVEYIMCGASTVQTATGVMWNGYGFISKLLRGFEGFMERKGYSSPEEFRGIALDDITTTEALAKEPPLFAQIDKSVCTGCGKCVKICLYRAISMSEGYGKADSSQCDGCGLCAQFCPTKAIRLCP